MSRLDIIHLRSAGESVESLSRKIQASIAGRDDGTTIVTLFRRVGLETDVAVHIRRPEVPDPEGAGELARILAAALRDYGLVEYAKWEEIES